MGSQLTVPLSSCWNSTALTPGLSLVCKISFPCLYFYIARWSFDNRYISAGTHLIHKIFTLYTVFPLYTLRDLFNISLWIRCAWSAGNYFSNRLQSQKYLVIPHNTQKNPCVVFATQKNPGVFHRPKKIPFGQNVRPKKILRSLPSLKYVSGAPGVLVMLAIFSGYVEMKVCQAYN